MSLDLVIDTSRPGARMGLFGGGLEHECFKRDARGESLSAVLEELLAASGAGLESVSRVLVLRGPGSFTGLRTGIAFAEGLCFSGRRELYGVSTLQALLSVFEGGSSAVIMKARPGFWYFSRGEGEFFVPTDFVLGELETIEIKNAVLDSEALSNGEISSELARRRVQVLNEADIGLSHFRKFFDVLSPSPVQDANYIQPSYAEQGR